MGKGVPKLETIHFSKESDIFSYMKIDNFSLTKMTLNQHESVKDVGNDLGGLLHMVSGDVIVTIGGTVKEVKSDMVLKIPKGFSIHIKAKSHSILYLLERIKPKPIPL